MPVKVIVCTAILVSSIFFGYMLSSDLTGNSILLSGCTLAFISSLFVLISIFVTSMCKQNELEDESLNRLMIFSNHGTENVLGVAQYKVDRSQILSTGAIWPRNLLERLVTYEQVFCMRLYNSQEKRGEMDVNRKDFVPVFFRMTKDSVSEKISFNPDEVIKLVGYGFTMEGFDSEIDRVLAELKIERLYFSVDETPDFIKLGNFYRPDSK